MKFLKSTGIYLLGNVLSKALAFILLPLYTKYISPADYGAYDLGMAYNTFIYSVLFLDIWSGVMLYIFDYKDKEKNSPVTVGMTIFSISSILYAVVLFLLGFVLNIEYKEFLFLLGFITSFQQVVGYVARANGKNSYFVICGLVGSLITLVLNIVLVSILHMNYSALYISSIVGLLINALLLAQLVGFWKMVRREYFDKILFKEMLTFSLPLSINSAAYWFLTGFNRVVISQQLSVADNGLYAVATKFSSMLQLVTTCFQMAWQELSFSKTKMNREDMGKFYTRALNEYIKFLYFGLILLLPVIKVIYPYVIDAKYASAVDLIPLAIYATFFSSISSFLASIINTLRKNKIIFTTTLVAAIVNVIVIMLLIDKIAIQAANISLCVGFIVNIARRVQLIKKEIDIQVDMKIFFVLTILFVIGNLIYSLTGSLWNILFFVVVCLIFVFSYKNQIMAIVKR